MTTQGLEALAEMEYPGRVIILGQDKEGYNVVIYGLSGRSPSSQARRLVANNNIVSIDVTDQEQLAKGDPALLVYNAIINNSVNNVVSVSNGVQTNLIARIVDRVDIPMPAILPFAFRKPEYMTTKDGRKIDITTFEPDSPNFTPRISGVSEISGNRAMIAICKRLSSGDLERCFYELALNPGQGFMVSTYSGKDVGKGEVLPSFVGEPKVVQLIGDRREIADSVYEAMGKYAVSACAFYPQQNPERRFFAKNLHGDK